MKVTGIIAEFNPFHNGHAYLLQKARETTEADVLVIVMSGNFVQRGAPAILSKYARAQAALCCGADLVVELPVFASCASAEYFSEGALRQLCDLGADSFVFGSESGDLSALLPLSALLCDEPETYQKHLRQALSMGQNFPVARRSAVHALMPDAAPLLDFPNNLLALEYLKACRRRGFPLRPYTVERIGSPYHEKTLPKGTVSVHTTILENFSSSNPFGGNLSPQSDFHLPFASASALREWIKTNAPHPEALFPYMPKAAAGIFAAELADKPPVDASDLSPLLAHCLLQCSLPAELAIYADMGVELANRVFARRYEPIDLPDFTVRLKTKEITYTRISRALLHTILRITGEEQEAFRLLPNTPYLRILGMRPAAQPLLARLKKEGTAPLILHPAKAKKILGETAYRFFMKDVAASELYRQLSFSHSHRPSACEFTHEIIRCE